MVSDLNYKNFTPLCGVKFFIMLLFAFLSSVTFAAASGEGTYGNETYGNFSYAVSSLASASFYNSSVNIPANASVILNATFITLEINVNINSSGAVTIVKYKSKPPLVGDNALTALNRYVDILVDNSIAAHVNYAIIKMFYTDDEAASANLDEASMRLYRWNGSKWIKFDGQGIGGVDSENNFVFANTSSFSAWGIFGSAVQAGSSSSSTSGGGTAGSSGGGGGGSETPFFVCGKDWECSEWSQCGSGKQKQSRECSFAKVPQHSQNEPCSEELKQPPTIRECEEKFEKINFTEKSIFSNFSKDANKISEKTNFAKKLIFSKPPEGLAALSGAFASNIKSIAANPNVIKEMEVISSTAVFSALGILIYKFMSKKIN